MSAERARPPFFIVGCSRSGTTLLQTLVDGHPSIALPPESQVYTRFAAIFATYGDLSQARNRRRLIGDLLADTYIRDWRLEATTADIERRISRPGRGGVLEALFSAYAASHGAERWGDKSPEHIRYLDLIRTDFPDAKLIHLVRDGRDTAEAMRRMIPGAVSAIGLAREWRREVMHWQAFCERAGNTGTLLLRYEDLVTNPAQVLETVFAFLDESFVDTIGSYATTPLSRQLGESTAWHSSLRRGINADKIGVYRSKLERRDIEIFESIAGDALRLYGYALDFADPKPAAAADRAAAVVTDRAVRYWRKLRNPTAASSELQLRARNALRRIAAWR